MKKKTGLVTLAGLALAAGAWRKFSEDLPIDGVIIPIDPGLKPPPPYSSGFARPLYCMSRRSISKINWRPVAMLA